MSKLREDRMVGMEACCHWEPRTGLLHRGIFAQNIPQPSTNASHYQCSALTKIRWPQKDLQSKHCQLSRLSSALPRYQLQDSWRFSHVFSCFLALNQPFFGISNWIFHEINQFLEMPTMETLPLLGSRHSPLDPTQTKSWAPYLKSDPKWPYKSATGEKCQGIWYHIFSKYLEYEVLAKIFYILYIIWYHMF